MAKRPSPDVLAYQQKRDRIMQAVEAVTERLPGATLVDAAIALNSGMMEEATLIQVIHHFLRTEEQRHLLFDLDMSLEALLNGRYTGEQEAQVYAIFDEWNKKLGTICFLSTKGKFGDPYPLATAPAPVAFGIEKSVRMVNQSDLIGLLGAHYGPVKAAQIPVLCGWEYTWVAGVTKIELEVTGHLPPRDPRIERFISRGTAGPEIALLLLDDLAREGIIPTGIYLIAVGL